MRGRVSNHLCRGNVIATTCAFIALLSSSAYASTISATITVTATGGASGAVLGYSGGTFGYSDLGAPISSLPVTTLVDMNGGNALNFGTFTLGATSSNVTPNFIMQVVPTITNPAPNPAATAIYFYGTIDTSASTIDFQTCGTDSTCAHPASISQYSIQNYPMSPPATTNFLFENTGSYSFGIDKAVPINTSGMKITAMFGFVAPSSATAPEPLPAATTGIALIGLLSFALRRKLQAARVR